MMQLSRFIKYMGCVTVLALIYIHMQMNIFCLAYDGRQKEQHVARLREQNGRVAGSIFELKSANSMGRKMLSQDARLKFYDENNVVQIAVAKPQSGLVRGAAPYQERANPFSRFWTWRFPSDAQAKESPELEPWQRRR